MQVYNPQEFDNVVHPINIKAIVWDFDKTLVATHLADEQAVSKLIQQHPDAIMGKELFWQLEGFPIMTRLERAWPGHGDEYIPYFYNKIRPQLCRGVTKVIKILKAHNYKLAVFSSRQNDALIWGLKATQLFNYFDSVVGLDDVKQPKPHPEGLLLTLSRLGVTPEETLYIGDSNLDQEAGVEAGVLFWRAVWCAKEQYLPTARNILFRPGEVTERLEKLATRKAS